MQTIHWQGHGVFDAQRLVSGSNTDPRFQSITVRGTERCHGRGEAQGGACERATHQHKPQHQVQVFSRVGSLDQDWLPLPCPFPLPRSAAKWRVRRWIRRSLMSWQARGVLPRHCALQLNALNTAGGLPAFRALRACMNSMKGSPQTLL